MFRVGIENDKLVVQRTKDDGTGNARKVWVPVTDEKLKENILVLVKDRAVKEDGYRYPSEINGYILSFLDWGNKQKAKREKLKPVDDRIGEEIRKHFKKG